MSERTKSDAPGIVVIGGGTGAPTVLRGLKEHASDVNIVAVPAMSDHGGSTGELRDEFGVLPPGDALRCILALSDNQALIDHASLRLPKGKSGRMNHTVGNVMLTAEETANNGDFGRAIEVVSGLFAVKGRIIPVTLDNNTLVLDDGDVRVEREDMIDKHTIQSSNPRISHEPKADINPLAAEAIENAEMVVIAPGSTYSSLIAAVAVNGVGIALKSTKAKKVMIANLMNKPTHTQGWAVHDHLDAIEQYISAGSIDDVIYNDTPPSRELVEKYAREGELPEAVDADTMEDITRIRGTQFKGAKLIANGSGGSQSPHDSIKRTLIRHDPSKIARQILGIYYP
jgi:uncharacterized cofD-like protein